MTNNDKSQPTFTIFTSLGEKVKKLLLLFLLFSGLLILVDAFTFKQRCSNEKNLCALSPIIVELYSAMLVTAITIVGIEITLRKDTIEEIRDIFRHTQATEYLKAVYPNRSDYSNKLREIITKLEAHKEVDMLCFSENMTILKDLDGGRKVIIEKLKQNCHFRILTLHPDSTLLECLRKVKFEKESEQMRLDLRSLFCKLAKDLPNNVSKGSIEVRLYRDIFSPFCYFSSNNFELIWIYLLNDLGFEYPAFEIADKNLIISLKEHFKSLWGKSDVLFMFENGIVEIDNTKEWLKNPELQPVQQPSDSKY